MITANDIRRAMEQRDRASVLAPLDGLTGAERAAVLDALEGTRDGARVNLPRLIERARRKVADAEAAGRRHAQPRAFRYYVDHVADIDQLHAMRTALKDGSSPAEAMAAAISMGRPEPTPRRIETAPRRAEQPQEPRKPVARYRGAKHGLRPRKRREKAAPVLTGRIIGRGDPDRPRGMSVDWDPSAAHPPPPWEHEEE